MTTSEARPGQHFCARHRVHYGALEQCGPCEKDPGRPPTEIAVKQAKPPKGCISSNAREAWFTKLANDALADVARLAKAFKPKRKSKAKAKAATEVVDDSDWHVEVAIKGHRETAIKAMRAAGELGIAREELAITEGRLRGSGHGASH